MGESLMEQCCMKIEGPRVMNFFLGEEAMTISEKKTSANSVQAIMVRQAYRRA